MRTGLRRKGIEKVQVAGRRFIVWKFVVYRLKSCQLETKNYKPETRNLHPLHYIHLSFQHYAKFFMNTAHYFPA